MQLSAFSKPTVGQVKYKTKLPTMHTSTVSLMLCLISGRVLCFSGVINQSAPIPQLYFTVPRVIG
jgi:hypothetical protein